MIHEYNVAIVGGGIAGACFLVRLSVNLSEDSDFVGQTAILRAQRHIFDSRIGNSTLKCKLWKKQMAYRVVKAIINSPRFVPKRLRLPKLY